MLTLVRQCTYQCLHLFLTDMLAPRNHLRSYLQLLTFSAYFTSLCHTSCASASSVASSSGLYRITLAPKFVDIFLIVLESVDTIISILFLVPFAVNMHLSSKLTPLISSKFFNFIPLASASCWYYCQYFHLFTIHDFS